MSQAKHRHLVRNVPNTEDNRKFIKQVNKMSKQSDSIWKLFIKYRKPKEGFKYGSGGSLKCENANAFSVYIDDRRPYGQRPENQYRNRLWEENRKLEEENEALKKQLAIYDNPYIDWRMSEISIELFEVKEEIIEKSLDNILASNVYKDRGERTLKEKYNLLMEALEYAEKHD